MSDDDWAAILDTAICGSMDDGEMILRWYLIAEWVDADGDRNLRRIGSPDLYAFEAKGLLIDALDKERRDEDE